MVKVTAKITPIILPSPSSPILCIKVELNQQMTDYEFFDFVKKSWTISGYGFVDDINKTLISNMEKPKNNTWYLKPFNLNSYTFSITHEYEKIDGGKPRTTTAKKPAAAAKPRTTTTKKPAAASKPSKPSKPRNAN